MEMRFNFAREVGSTTLKAMFYAEIEFYFCLGNMHKSRMLHLQHNLTILSLFFNLKPPKADTSIKFRYNQTNQNEMNERTKE